MNWDVEERAEDLLEQERARTARWKAAAKRWKYVQLAEDAWTDPPGDHTPGEYDEPMDSIVPDPPYDGWPPVPLDSRCIYCGSTTGRHGCTGACEP